MAKNVITIPATISKFTASPLGSRKKRKVAAYARVSTDRDEQLTSYEAQVDYYTNYIKGREDWEFVAVYADEGITGCNTTHRDGFNSMVEDALAGRIDLIVTKSVSRFARNTVDSLTAIRKLKENGTECYFEKENIWTFDGKGELLLTIMSRPKVSIKSDKRMYNGTSGAFLIENCHEPIIPPKEWELVQTLITSRRKVLADGAELYDNIFSGLLKCGGCGYAMSTSVDRRSKRSLIIDKTSYQCTRYRSRGLAYCTAHSVSARDLYDKVLEDIKRIANNAVTNDKKLLDSIIRNLRKNETDKSEQDERDLKKHTKRLTELDNLFAKLYEDRVNGTITERNYNTLSAKYEQEQIELEEKINVLTAVIKENKANDENAEAFVEMIKEYADITELNAAMLNRLIDRIVVNEPEETDGEDEPIQKVDIYYKFVGIID